MQQIEVDLRQRYSRVEVQSWSEPLVRQLLAHGIQKLLAKFRQIFLAQTHSCRHFVPAKFFQRSAAFAEGPHDRTTLDTASASFSCTALVKPHYNRRPVIFFGDARRDDPKNARMPATRAQDDSAIPRCIKIFDEFLFSLLQNLFFNFLPFPVLSVQFTRELPGFDRTVRYQQTQRFLSRGQATSRIQTRIQPEANVIRHYRLLYPSDLH